MANTMTKWGVGPKFTIFSFIYCLIMLGLTTYFNPFLKITKSRAISYQGLELIGAVLIVLGIPFYLFAIVSVMRAFKEGQLVTTGVYGMCRHPVYAAWVVFFVPSIALFFDSWVLLSAPFIMYLIARALVAKEDVYLEEAFGPEYLAYKKQVPAFIPYGWMKKKRS
jgi:protein-S-isoprenylcysteine O-methyltransferase Ste14